MSTAGSVSINEDDRRVTIESLNIEDPEIVDFLTEYESDRRTKIVTEALTIGMKTMQLMDTSQDVQYVEQRLGDLEDKLTRRSKSFKKNSKTRSVTTAIFRLYSTNMSVKTAPFRNGSRQHSQKMDYSSSD